MLLLLACTGDKVTLPVETGADSARADTSSRDTSDTADTATSPPPTPILADYDAEPREAVPRADGYLHVDSALLVDRLLTLGATHYLFLLYHSPTDWEDLHEYLPLAEAAGLETWVYLVPPTEIPASYPPFEDDYVAWGDAIGELATHYPSLRAFAMDDFNSNTVTFTDAYTCEMRDAARVWAPELEFWPVDYYGDAEIDLSVRTCWDGLIFPYIDLDDNSALREQIDVLAETLGEPGGVTLTLQWPWDAPSTAGTGARWSAAATTDATGGTLSFRFSDSYGGPTAGYHLARVTWDETTLWSEDIGGSEAGGATELTLPAGATGTLGFELYEESGVSNYGVVARFGAISSTGLSLGAFSYEEDDALFDGTSLDGGEGAPLRLLPMIYATSTSWHAAPPTAAVVQEAVEIALLAFDEGVTEGVTTYCLDKTPGAASYEAVTTVYTAR